MLNNLLKLIVFFSFYTLFLTINYAQFIIKIGIINLNNETINLV
ncbi:MAG: hypothetical protein KatS3mg068_2053 [Candidatus Sericytochromatia bacterium]|nr:MAG: hypothetical protein KatS3mg068_2053 [Candidatus Sericytochromatia bacterium]